ncbi:nicotinamide riboside transporter PnuC [Marinimicrobium sp. C6131]|uniref:nicotinamide riboside transporter PnuC n=1 Tax=Marinimicrobium sp. C6131 TaxID=3022676 RepID=UPI00223E8EB2|nr:nicotinamide riboside transporter PnuC [Marinimicrobium sp. C6131]UZJ44662.1 nicotinamide riboside transporter PnuC [Marinimicrobium sp. C6131]
MNDITQQVADTWSQWLGWELVAVTLALAYLVLAVRQNALCWYAGFLSTAIYTALYWNVSLLMESALNVYYMVMAVYGWWQWRHGGRGDTELPVQTWPWRTHALVMGGIFLVSVASGTWLSYFTQAAWPYLDSFTTWAAVVTTYMVARKVLENWLYWMIINSLQMIILWERSLYLTALLMALYLVISVFGWLSWVRDYRSQKRDDAREAACA